MSHVNIGTWSNKVDKSKMDSLLYLTMKMSLLSQIIQHNKDNQEHVYLLIEGEKYVVETKCV